TPESLAALHARCFTLPRPWSAEEFRDLLALPGSFLIAEPGGFLLGRAVADEAELLTLAVDPALRRRGAGQRLVAQFLAAAAARGAGRAFLEVAETNLAARALYARAGFSEVGRRRGYYRPETGPAVDALALARATAGKSPAI
ncbi:MAG: GNAT family N-acetyltransferase, partial [Rhodobacteraceae bacterium]|nr:GNAT family N-acetyltransferase [Paracoccaceae bacterium]